MDGQQPQVSHAVGTEPVGQAASADFAAPLGSMTSGRLLFAASAVGVTIQADPMLAELYQAHFERYVPGVRVQEGTVTIKYGRAQWRGPAGRALWAPFSDPSADMPEARWTPFANVTLNGTIPWEIEFRGGVAGLTAHLSGLPLRALDLGSASGSMITLPPPAGVVFVYIAGSASDITISRPQGVAVRIEIGGSVSNLTLDGQPFGAGADGIRWQTPGYNSVADRYDLSIAGSASNLTLV